MRSFAILGAVLSTLAGIASAWTQPVGDPTGNPIARPSLHEKVPVGKPYTITWEPTLHPEGTVTLLLVKGPSNNVVPQYAIVEKTPNNGKYVWTPDASLPDSTEGYGIQLIVDTTGQYQWSTQFGFSNTGVVDHTTTTTTAITTTTTGATTEETTVKVYPHSTTEVSHYPTTTTEKSDYPVTTITPVKTTTTTLPVRNTTIVNSYTTTTTPIAAKTTTHQAGNTTYAVSTFSSVTVTPTNTPIHPKPSAPTSNTSGVSQNVVPFGMALLALAVAGFSMF